jgi:hypothetical protein
MLTSKYGIPSLLMTGRTESINVLFYSKVWYTYPNANPCGSSVFGYLCIRSHYERKANAS